MGWSTRGTYVTLQPRFERTDPSAVAPFSQSLVTREHAPLASTISSPFYWRRRHSNGASPQRGRSVVSGARCAERASEAGARGRINKISGRLITAIPFGSAARRCSWENGIFCYQMTVRLRLFLPNSSGFEVSRRCSSATSEKLNDVERVRNGGINRRAKSSPSRTWLFG